MTEQVFRLDSRDDNSAFKSFDFCHNPLILFVCIDLNNPYLTSCPNEMRHVCNCGVGITQNSNVAQIRFLDDTPGRNRCPEI